MILKFHTPSNRATKHKTKQDFKKKSIHLPKTEGFLLSVSQILVNQEDQNQLTIEILKSKLKGLSNGDYEAYEVELAKATPDNTVVFHASVPVMYDERLMEQDFVLANGKVGRAYIPERGDIITIAETVVTGSPNVGDKIGCVGDGKLANPGATKIAKVLAKENFGGQPSVVIEFI